MIPTFRAIFDNPTVSLSIYNTSLQAAKDLTRRKTSLFIGGGIPDRDVTTIKDFIYYQYMKEQRAALYTPRTVPQPRLIITAS
jgi:hypothetical protein